MNEIREFRLPAIVMMVVGAILLTIPAVANAERQVEGRSKTLQLEDLVPSNEGVDQLQGLGRALDGLGSVTAESLSAVRQARMAYEANPCGETEAGLFNANAQVIRSQYEALGDVKHAADEAKSVLEKLRRDTSTAEGTFAGQVADTERERRKASEVVEQIEGELMGLAERFEEIVGPDGQIKDEDVENAVIEAKVSWEYQSLVADLAEGDAVAARTDLTDLAEVATRLRQQQGRLRVIAIRAQSQRAALASVARSQIGRMKRRGVLLRAVDFIKWADTLDASGILDGKPVIALPAPGGSVLADSGLPEISGRRGADILREMRDKAADHKQTPVSSVTP